MQLVVRDAVSADIGEVLRLYQQLNDDDPILDVETAMRTFERIRSTPGLQLLVLDLGGRIVATTYLNVIPNLTRRGAPYAVIENVVVEQTMRGTGLGRRIMEATLDAAWVADGTAA